MRRLLLSVVVAALVSVPLASAALRQTTRYPSSMVVLGTSTAAGWGADAAHPFRAAPEDSWATGTNPAVQSIYSRILALNPAIKGHNVDRGSFASYVSYVKSLDVGKRLKNAGKKPCQLVESPSGRVATDRVAYTKSIVAGEEAQLKAACTKVANCRYDGVAAQRIAVTATDVSEFQYTPTIQGQAKLAAAEWKTLAGFVKGQ